MVFSSTTFLFVFLPIVLLGHTLLKTTSGRNVFLLVLSLFFYAWGEGPVVLVMLNAILVNHFAALWIVKAPDAKIRKRRMAYTVAYDIGMLVVFKYTNFLVDNLNIGLQMLSINPLYIGTVHLPIGISFFIFQSLSYVLDVYRNDTEVQRKIARTALYITLFPQLIAGPIVRYTDVAAQMESRRVRRDAFAEGVQRFIIGLSKKVLLADPLGYIADQLFGAPVGVLGMDAAWLGAVCYGFQIYFDFSAYSDMAIGLGKMLGFQFMENFNYPYIAASVREFWRRWHISLSTWFRDYLYIPLGGSHASAQRTYTNLLIVFFLCGLWHGASWNFVAWGLLHGFFLALERAGLERLVRRLPAVLRHAYVLFVVLIGWVLFRAEDGAHAWQYLQAMAGGNVAPTYYAAFYFDPEILLTLVMAAVFSTPLYPVLERWSSKQGNGVEAFRLLLLLGLFAFSVSTLVNSTYNPFIYFRF
ncbi:MAG: MBOAT family protein [Saprospiraceae bacterium]|nr:MBOAT family protein [Saprospiraceae bacterium]